MMKESIFISYYYRKAIGKTVRILFFSFALALLYSQVHEGVFPRIPLILLLSFFMMEVFYRHKLSHVQTSVYLQENSTNPWASFSRNALEVVVTAQDSLLNGSLFLKFPQVQFIMGKIGIFGGKIPNMEIQRDVLVKKAFEIAIESHGLYITTMDLFVAYLLVTEDKTKLLFANEIKEDALLRILKWARAEFPYEEVSHPLRVHFDGAGFGDFFVYGWTPDTQLYTRDITFPSVSKKPLLIGREKEFNQLSTALQKQDHNNVLLVGERGVGKETIVEALAYKSYMGQLSSFLNHKRIYELLSGQLFAGADNRSLLENRLQSIISEITHSGNVIIYIPEFQNMLGASSYQIDISATLLPYLKNGSVPIIASITPSQYKLFVENNSIREVFSIITLDEPSSDDAINMLYQKALALEKKYRCVVSYNAIVWCVQFGKRYVGNGFLPGCAAVLLEDVVNAVVSQKRKMVTKQDVINAIEEKTHIAVGVPKSEEKELLLTLEEKIHTRLIGQDEAVKAIAESMRRLRMGISSTDKPISFLFLGPTGVGKTETAKALSAFYFGSEDAMLRFDMSEYASAESVKRLLGSSPGEGNEKGELSEKVYDKPYSLILLDEFEKAHSSILDLFLQVLDEGRLTDNKGKTVSFVNSIIIATSNAGSSFIREQIHQGRDATLKKDLVEHLLNSNLFRPELLNRFDEVIVYKPLEEKEIVQVVDIMLARLQKKMADKDITVSFEAKVRERIAQEGYEKEFGARPIERYIQNHIEDLLASHMLQEKVVRGAIIQVSIDSSGNYCLIMQ